MAAYTGLQCNGLLVETFEPISDTAARECRTLDSPSQVSAVIFSVSEDNADTWVFGLHDDGACVDDAGDYIRELFPATCLE